MEQGASNEGTAPTAADPLPTTLYPPLRRFWLALLALTVAILVCLPFLPNCGLLVRSQLITLVRMPQAMAQITHDLQGTTSQSNIPLHAPEVTPGDYVSAFENALTPASNQGFSRERTRRLMQLATAFPEHTVTLYAHALRYATSSEVQLHSRPEEQKFLYPTQPALAAPLKGTSTSPEARSNFLQMAEAGERLDAGNAYFPLMQAIALFDARRDEEGLEAYMRASRATHFDDYSWDEVELRSRYLVEMGGALRWAGWQ